MILWLRQQALQGIQVGSMSNRCMRIMFAAFLTGHVWSCHRWVYWPSMSISTHGASQPIDPWAAHSESTCCWSFINDEPFPKKSGMDIWNDRWPASAIKSYAIFCEKTLGFRVHMNKLSWIHACTCFLTSINIPSGSSSQYAQFESTCLSLYHRNSICWYPHFGSYTCHNLKPLPYHGTISCQGVAGAGVLIVPWNLGCRRTGTQRTSRCQGTLWPEWLCYLWIELNRSVNLLIYWHRLTFNIMLRYAHLYMYVYHIDLMYAHTHTRFSLSLSLGFFLCLCLFL